MVQQIVSPASVRTCTHTSCLRGSRPANAPFASVAVARSVDLPGRNRACGDGERLLGAARLILVVDEAVAVVVDAAAQSSGVRPAWRRS
jgi:hypothetical protein